MFLHHTTITAHPDKLKETISFYENLCDLTPIMTPPGLKNAIWYEMLGTDNGAQLHIYITKEAQPLCGGAHISFVVSGRHDDGDVYRRVVALAKREGFFLGEGTQYWGSPRCFIMDPAGNRVELLQFSPSPYPHV